MMFRRKPAGTVQPPAAGPADPSMDGARSLYNSILQRGGIAPADVGKYGIREDDVLGELADRVRRAEGSQDPTAEARAQAAGAYTWFMGFYNKAKEKSEKASQGPPVPDSPVPDYLPLGSEPGTAPEPPPAPSGNDSPYAPISQAWGKALGPGTGTAPPAAPARSRFKFKNPFKRQNTAKPKKPKVTYEFESHSGANVYYGSDGSAILIPDSGAAQYLSKGTDLLTPLKQGRVMRGRFYGDRAQVEAVVEHLKNSSTVFSAGAKATISRLKGNIPMDFEADWLGSRVIVYGTKEDLETVSEMARKELDALWALDALAENIKGPRKPTYGPPPAELVGPPMAPPPAPPMAPPPVRVPPAARDLGLGEEEFSGPAPPPWSVPAPEPAPSFPRIVRDLGREESTSLPPPPPPAPPEPPRFAPPPPPPYPLPPPPRVIRDVSIEGSAPPPPPPAPPESPVELDVEPVASPRRNGGTPGEAQPADEDPYAKW